MGRTYGVTTMPPGSSCLSSVTRTAELSRACLAWARATVAVARTGSSAGCFLKNASKTGGVTGAGSPLIPKDFQENGRKGGRYWICKMKWYTTQKKRREGDRKHERIEKIHKRDLVCKPPGTSCMSSVTRTTELTRACLTWTRTTVAVTRTGTSAGCFLMLTMEKMNYCTLSKHGASCDLTRVTDTAKDW